MKYKDYNKYGYVAGIFIGIGFLFGVFVSFVHWNISWLVVAFGLMSIGVLIFATALSKQLKEFNNEWNAL